MSKKRATAKTPKTDFRSRKGVPTPVADLRRFQRRMDYWRGVLANSLDTFEAFGVKSPLLTAFPTAERGMEYIEGFINNVQKLSNDVASGAADLQADVDAARNDRDA